MSDQIPDGPGAGFARAAAAIEASGRRYRYSGPGQLMFSCPGPNHTNGDRNPSGSLTRGPDGAGIYCHRECPAEDIAAAFGFELRDLFDHRREAGQQSDAWMPCVREHGHRVAHVHRYTDPDGHLIAEKLRCDHKSSCPTGGLIWRRPDPSARSGWRYRGALDGIEVPLYRAMDAARAVRDAANMHLCEGESDTDALHARGLLAASAPHGAWKDRDRPGRKWLPSYTEALRGAHVVLCVDLDPAGKAHAENVANAIVEVVASLVVVAPARGKDVRDHLDAGLGLDDLHILATPKPRRAPLAKDDPVAVDGHLVDPATGEILPAEPESTPAPPSRVVTVVDDGPTPRADPRPEPESSPFAWGPGSLTACADCGVPTFCRVDGAPRHVRCPDEWPPVPTRRAAIRPAAAPLLDWSRTGGVGDPVKCVICMRPAICRDPAGRPCHKACAEARADVVGVAAA